MPFCPLFSCNLNYTAFQGGWWEGALFSGPSVNLCSLFSFWVVLTRSWEISVNTHRGLFLQNCVENYRSWARFFCVAHWQASVLGPPATSCPHTPLCVFSSGRPPGSLCVPRACMWPGNFLQTESRRIVRFSWWFSLSRASPFWAAWCSTSETCCCNVLSGYLVLSKWINSFRSDPLYFHLSRGRIQWISFLSYFLFLQILSFL